MISPHLSKNSSRVHLRNLLEQKKPYQDQVIQDQLCQHLLQFMTLQNGYWAGFQPLHEEPHWTSIQTALPKIKWAYPRMNHESLEFVVDPQAFVPGPFGVSEPVGGSRIELNQIQGCLIPGLGFSKSGQRLGRGKGYYDRALSDFSGQRVGLCFSIQFLETDLPCEAHDVNVDHVVTELGVFDV